jgi:hypothetical protein
MKALLKIKAAPLEVSCWAIRSPEEFSGKSSFRSGEPLFRLSPGDGVRDVPTEFDRKLRVFASRSENGVAKGSSLPPVERRNCGASQGIKDFEPMRPTGGKDRLKNQEERLATTRKIRNGPGHIKTFLGDRADPIDSVSLDQRSKRPGRGGNDLILVL